MSYKKGSDLKIKGIDNLNGLPDMTIYKTDKIISIEAGDFGLFLFKGKPSGFTKIKIQNLDQ